MFGLFRSEPRRSEQTLDATNSPLRRIQSSFAGSRLASAPNGGSASKRGRECSGRPDESIGLVASPKRAKLVPDKLRNGGTENAHQHVPAFSSLSRDTDRVRDVICHQFGLEILCKHHELRLINQELAKCQIALEQLRRCHLIPYPQNCPTPDQMLDISDGKGLSLAASAQEPVPRWAPPFGVVDGPYARHYAKWLIPDPSFDGLQPESQSPFEAARPRASLSEGRATRNSISETAVTAKGRPVRGSAGMKLQSLSNGYPIVKDKAGPCVLKRADGQTVKLVCLDCRRENFSSTQGFINHCRIAHKRDFKSHEEAAVQSGQPVEAADQGSTAISEKAPVASSSSTLVHPLARQDIAEQQTYTALRSRIDDSLKLYHAGQLPSVDRIPSLRGHRKFGTSGRRRLDPVSETPHLSRLMEGREFGGSLQNLVADAKTRTVVEDSAPEDEEELEDEMSLVCTPVGGNEASPGLSAADVRMPARSSRSSGLIATSSRPASRKGHVAKASMIPHKRGANSTDASVMALSDEDVYMEEVNLSPNTLTSNNAPSLVSDDGEYDESDEGSSVSEASDHDAASVSVIAEINLDEDHEPRALRRGSGGVTNSMRLRKDDPKHVTFMTSLRSGARRGRRRRV